MEILIGDIVQTRKKHPCGNDQWVVIRVGADIKIKCRQCARIVMLERPEFEKRLKKKLGNITEENNANEDGKA